MVIDGERPMASKHIGEIQTIDKAFERHGDVPFEWECYAPFAEYRRFGYQINQFLQPNQGGKIFTKRFYKIYRSELLRKDIVR